jgi:hypothetical protein
MNNTIDQEVFSRLKKIAKEYGFDSADKKNNSIYKIKEHIIDCISCTITYMRGEYNGALFCTKFYENIEKYLEPYYNDLEIDKNIKHLTVLFSHRFENQILASQINDVYQISIENTTKGFSDFCDLLEYDITEIMLPISKRFDNINYLEGRIRTSLKGYNEFSDITLEKDLLRYLDRPDFRFRIPIIAKLAKVNDFDHVGESMIKEMKRLVNIDKKYQYMLDVMYNLLNDLEYTPR